MKVFTTPNRYILAGIMMLSVLISCNEDEFEQATVTFYPTLEAAVDEPGPGQPGVPTVITVQTSRVLANESQINVRIRGNGAGYGNSYTTNPPQLQPGIITLTIPANETSASFTFIPRYDGIVEPADYKYTFTIEQFSNSIRSVGQDEFKLTVREGRLRSYNFNTCSGIPAGFSEQIATGDGVMTASTWTCTSFGFPNDTPNAVEANAFGKGTGTSNSYFVMDAIDGTQLSTYYIDFEMYSRFSGPGTITVLYSTNYSGTGNPEAEGVTWNTIDVSSQFPTAGSRVWNHVAGEVEIPGANQVYFAFRFQGGTGAASANWRLDDIVIKAE